MRSLLVFTALLFAFPAQAEVTIDWVTVGDPGNACETQSQGCFGAVPYSYRISKYAVTNAQYAEFLNAVAATDTFGLYNTSMGSGKGGITRIGVSEPYTYSPIAGRVEMPVNWVSFWDATRFTNWLHNGQPTGAQDDSTTEDGAYTITPEGITNNTITRNAEATVFLTSQDEWYKAAYYKGGGTSAGYWDYPAGSDTQTTCAAAGATANTANCANAAMSDLTDVGSYTGSPSPYGTFDQGGNVWEKNETIISGSARGMRGGAFYNTPSTLAASFRGTNDPTSEQDVVGFRVASPVEPIPALSPAGLLVFAAGLVGLLGFGAYRRGRA
jgi:formylglycine-generating enzyme required for sulfatase activity